MKYASDVHVNINANRHILVYVRAILSRLKQINLYIFLGFSDTILTKVRYI